MKKIFTPTNSSIPQSLRTTLSSASRSSIDQTTNPNPQPSPLVIDTKTENSTLSYFSQAIFGQCCPVVQFQKSSVLRIYHKLQYKSLERKQKDKTDNFYSDNKTCSLRNPPKQSDSQNNPDNYHITTDRPALNLITADKMPPRDPCYVTQIPLVRNGEKRDTLGNLKDQQTKIGFHEQKGEDQEIFLSQDIKVYRDQIIDNVKRLSTLDSYKLKQNLQTEFSQAVRNLDHISKLCSSIDLKNSNKIKVDDRFQKDNCFTFQQDQMKDSLIHMLFSEEKEQTFIEQKIKKFIRAPIDSDTINNGKKLSQKKIKNQIKQQNHDQINSISFNKNGSKPTLQKRMNLNKIKTLDQCGRTIVSRFNNSSQRKSVLQQSNIVFQASKQCSDFMYNENNCGAILSDSQIRYDKQNKIDKHLQNRGYNSFAEEFSQTVRQKGSGLNNLLKNRFLSGKIKDNFLRSNKADPNQVISKDYDLEEIRFDLDTLVEDGSL